MSSFVIRRKWEEPALNEPCLVGTTFRGYMRSQHVNRQRLITFNCHLGVPLQPTNNENEFFRLINL